MEVRRRSPEEVHPSFTRRLASPVFLSGFSCVFAGHNLARASWLAAKG